MRIGIKVAYYYFEPTAPQKKFISTNKRYNSIQASLQQTGLKLIIVYVVPRFNKWFLRQVQSYNNVFISILMFSDIKSR